MGTKPQGQLIHDRVPKRNMTSCRNRQPATVGTVHFFKLKRQARMACSALFCLVSLTVVMHNSVAETTDKPVTLTPADWPGFLGPQRNGKSPERGLPTTWPESGPPIIWQRPIGTGYAAPAISNDRVYHFARFANSARLTCFNAESGAELWTREHPTDYEDLLGYNNGPRATPIVQGPHVFTYSAEGILQCVRVADGTPVWRVDTIKDFHVVKNFFGVGSTPLALRDLVLVNVGGSPPDSPPDVYSANGRVRSSGSAIVAFDSATGKVRWKTGEDLASYASPIVDTNR